MRDDDGMVDIAKEQGRVIRLYDSLVHETPSMIVRNMKNVGASSLTKTSINAQFQKQRQGQINEQVI